MNLRSTSQLKHEVSLELKRRGTGKLDSGKMFGKVKHMELSVGIGYLPCPIKVRTYLTSPPTSRAPTRAKVLYFQPTQAITATLIERK